MNSCSELLNIPFLDEHNCYPSTPECTPTNCEECSEFLQDAKYFATMIQFGQLSHYCFKSELHNIRGEIWKEWCFVCEEEQAVLDFIATYREKSRKSLLEQWQMIQKIHGLTYCIHYTQDAPCSFCVGICEHYLSSQQMKVDLLRQRRYLKASVHYKEGQR